MSVNYNIEQNIEQKSPPVWARQDMEKQNIKSGDIFTGSKIQNQQKNLTYL